MPPQQERTLAVLTPDQVRALLGATRPRDRALLALTVATGMRQGEALGVRLANLNLLRRELAIEEQCITPPTGRPYITTDLKTRASRRGVPLPQFAIDAVARHLETEPLGEGGALFVSPRATSGAAAASTSRSGNRRCAQLGSTRGTGSTHCVTRKRRGPFRKGCTRG